MQLFIVMALASVALFSGLVLAMAARVSRQWRDEADENLPA